jgi:hypothetical protein
VKRLLTIAEAAEYLGVGREFIANQCPVKPLRIRPGQRGLRYDVRALDAWLNNPSREPGETSLYRHFSSWGRLLYVGISLDVISRLSDHRASRWFDHIARVEIQRYPTREAALAAEAEAIHTEKPLFNITGKVAT